MNGFETMKTSFDIESNYFLNYYAVGSAVSSVQNAANNTISFVAIQYSVSQCRPLHML